MRISEDLLADDLRPRVLAVILRVADVEALRRGVAIKSSLCQVNLVGLCALEVRKISEDQASIVGRVLTQRQLAIHFHIVYCGERSVLVDEAVGARVELLRVLGGPPVRSGCPSRRTCVLAVVEAMRPVHGR